MLSIFCPVSRCPSEMENVASLVIHELKCAEGGSVYLMIRFRDLTGVLADSDHCFLSMEEALDEAECSFGVSRSNWQPLSDEEAARIDSSIHNGIG